MIVVDTSAVVDALVGRPPNRALLERLAVDGDLHAPQSLDLEVLGVLARLVSARALTVDRADDARADFDMLAVLRYPELPLLDRAWQLRRQTGPRSAVFVALAELLDAPLVTTDPALAVVKGLRAPVEVYAAI